MKQQDATLLMETHEISRLLDRRKKFQYGKDHGENQKITAVKGLLGESSSERVIL